MSRPCIVVAGLGRCGTSLMMQMLDAGGVPCVGDRPAFEDARTRPREFRPDWFAGLSECAVKILDAHRLPIRDMPNHVVIWLMRDKMEQGRSALKLVGAEQNRKSVRAMASGLMRDTPIARARLGLPGGCPGVTIRFEDLILRPSVIFGRAAEFLAPHGYSLDIGRAASVVVPRRPECLPYLLEPHLLEAAR